MITYRIATESDLPALADLRWEHWSEDAQNAGVVDQKTFQEEFVKRVSPWLQSGQLTVWLAESAGEIIANMHVQRVNKIPKPSKLDDCFGYVSNVHTRAAYRNQGVGSMLLQHVQQWALEHDMEFLVLWPSERSVPFYQRAGFTVGEAIEFEVRPYVG